MGETHMENMPRLMLWRPCKQQKGRWWGELWGMITAIVLFWKFESYWLPIIWFYVRGSSFSSLEFCPLYDLQLPNLAPQFIIIIKWIEKLDFIFLGKGQFVLSFHATLRRVAFIWALLYCSVVIFHIKKVGNIAFLSCFLDGVVCK